MTIHYDMKMRALKCMQINDFNKSEIAKCYLVSRKSLYNWEKGVHINKVTTRKKKLTPAIKCYIRTYVISRISFQYKLLIKNIQRKYNVKIGKTLLYDTLKSMNIVRKKVNQKTVFMTQRRKRKLVTALKKTVKKISLNDIISLDESSIDTHIDNPYGWGVKGTKITIIKKQQKVRYTVTCAVKMNGEMETQIIKGSANANTFLTFIKNIVSKLPTNKITYILLDNARIHHAKILKTYLSGITNVKFIYNVPYCPEYNPIEKVFSEVKAIIRKKYITNSNITKIITKSFSKVKKRNIKQYFKKSLSF